MIRTSVAAIDRFIQYFQVNACRFDFKFPCLISIINHQ
jgi:hypothetical protein